LISRESAPEDRRDIAGRAGKARDLLAALVPVREKVPVRSRPGTWQSSFGAPPEVSPARSWCSRRRLSRDAFGVVLLAEVRQRRARTRVWNRW